MTEHAFTDDLGAIAADLAAHDDFVIAGHISPDGDCLGSQLALMHALHAMGKRARCILAKREPVEYGLRFLPGVDDMTCAADGVRPNETFIAVDVPTAERMAYPAATQHAHANHTVTIDHHPSDVPMSDISYTDATAAAAALIIWDLIAALGVKPDATMAICCYTGLITDTGRFQFQNTDARALTAAAQMVASGASPADIACKVFQNRSYASLMLEARMLEHMEYVGESAVFSYLTAADFAEFDAVKSDAEPLINVLRSLRGVRVAGILRDQKDGVRGSLRSKDDTDVAAIAAKIGGGGHRAAAGFTFDGDMDGARACLREHLEALKIG